MAASAVGSVGSVTGPGYAMCPGVSSKGAYSSLGEGFGCAAAQQFNHKLRRCGAHERFRQPIAWQRRAGPECRPPLVAPSAADTSVGRDGVSAQWTRGCQRDFRQRSTVNTRRVGCPASFLGGVTYGISQTRFEATRALLARFAEGHTLGVAMSLTHDGARHHLFITPPGCRSRWWNDESAVVES